MMKKAVISLDLLFALIVLTSLMAMILSITNLQSNQSSTYADSVSADSTSIFVGTQINSLGNGAVFDYTLLQPIKLFGKTISADVTSNNLQVTAIVGNSTSKYPVLRDD